MSFVGFSLSSRNVSLNTVLYLVHWLPPVLNVTYMQYILHDCTLPVCIIISHKNTTCTLSSLTYVQLCIFTHNTHIINAPMNTRASIIWCQISEKATTWEGTNEKSFAMPPNNITILAICTVLCICAGGGV